MLVRNPGEEILNALGKTVHLDFTFILRVNYLNYKLPRIRRNNLILESNRCQLRYRVWATFYTLKSRTQCGGVRSRSSGLSRTDLTLAGPWAHEDSSVAKTRGSRSGRAWNHLQSSQTSVHSSPRTITFLVEELRHWRASKALQLIRIWAGIDKHKVNPSVFPVHKRETVICETGRVIRLADWCSIVISKSIKQFLPSPSRLRYSPKWEIARPIYTSG